MEGDLTIQAEDGTELVISAHDLKMVTGYYDLETRLAESEQREARILNSLEQMLGYMNSIDERIQRYAGEGTVTQSVVPHIDQAGYLRFDLTPPVVPDEILRAFAQKGGPNSSSAEIPREMRILAQ